MCCSSIWAGSGGGRNHQDEEETKERGKDVEEEEIGVQEEPLQLALSALNGVSTYYTMRVTGRIKK